MSELTRRNFLGVAAGATAVKVSELQKLIPIESVSEMQTEKRYLVKIPEGFPMNIAAEIVRHLGEAGIRGVVAPADWEFYELP